MIDQLKKEVCDANKELYNKGLTILTWGNVSARINDMIAIKPSGVDYECLSPDKIVVLDLDGNTLEGNLKPSSDTQTHLELYRNFNNINSIVHTHSKFATSYCQAGKTIDVLGTTQADYFPFPVPVIDSLSQNEVETDYVLNVGKKIVNYFQENDISPLEMRACLPLFHAPFIWANTTKKALELTEVLENLAEMNLITNQLGVDKKIDPYLIEKHFYRKHGKSATYGQ